MEIYVAYAFAVVLGGRIAYRLFLLARGVWQGWKGVLPPE